MLSLLLAAEVTVAIINAHVWTGDPAHPTAQAIAISDDRIAAIGSNTDIQQRPATRTIDARGATVLPGFIDSHTHILQYVESKHTQIFLRFRKTRKDVVEAVEAYAASLPPGEWILGIGWTTPPSRQWFDHLTPKHPVWLRAQGQSTGVANAAALRLAGIDPATTPTGLVTGSDAARIDRALVDAAGEQDVERALKTIAAAGITSVHHTGGWTDLVLLRKLHAEGRLPVRVYCCPQLSSWSRLRDYVREHGPGDDWLRWTCLKGFGTMTDDEAYTWVSGAARSGLQVMTHVAPQPGLAGMLRIYNRVAREQNLHDPRFRIEHAHHMPPEVLAAYKASSVIASVQPPLLRQLPAYPWRDVLDAGIRIALGTDSPTGISIVPPLASIQLALSRGQTLTLDEALHAYTAAGAHAEFAEHRKGTLRTGMLADVVVLDRDIRRDLANARVRFTITGGKVTHEAVW